MVYRYQLESAAQFFATREQMTSEPSAWPVYKAADALLAGGQKGRWPVRLTHPLAEGQLFPGHHPPSWAARECLQLLVEFNH